MVSSVSIGFDFIYILLFVFLKDAIMTFIYIYFNYFSYLLFSNKIITDVHVKEVMFSTCSLTFAKVMAESSNII